MRIEIEITNLKGEFWKIEAIKIGGFAVHKSIDIAGYTLTELGTGLAVIQRVEKALPLKDSESRPSA